MKAYVPANLQSPRQADECSWQAEDWTLLTATCSACLLLCRPPNPWVNIASVCPPPPWLACPSTPAAYFFTRSILLCIRTLEGKDDTPFDAVWKGWVLTGFFFVDAWLLGE